MNRQIAKKQKLICFFSIVSTVLIASFPEKACAELWVSIPCASIIKISPPAPDKYQDLVCTAQDKIWIGEIVTTISQNNKWDLIWEEGRLTEIGAKISHVHPLKFLSTVLMNPMLKECMPGIFDDYFKRNGLLGYRLIGGRPADGLGSGLSREADKNKLDQYLEDFAKEIQVPLDAMRHYFQMRDWENLVRFLIQM